MTQIQNIHARMVIDSRGNPTVEADVILADGSLGRASVPSGASTGSKEAVELRDGNSNFYGGMGVDKAIDNINNKISLLLKGKDASNQEEIDSLMINLDGTENKSNLGANAILAVSIGVAIAQAKSQNIKLFEYLSKTAEYSMPTPMMNIINGGAHADNNVDIQEFMIIPAGRPSFTEAIRCGSEIFQSLKLNLSKKKISNHRW